MMAPQEQFRGAIARAGLMPPEVVVADGNVRRFSTNGKRTDDAGWYVLYDDGIPAGAFGDWRSGLTQTWRADIGRALTPAEEAAHRAKVEAIQRERQAEETRERAEAAKKAAAIWKEAQPGADDHPYLTRKCRKAHGLRLYRGPLVIREMPCDGSLIVPARDGSGAIHTLQFIHPEPRDGDNKRFLFGGGYQGCYYSFGNPKGAVAICIAEGFATGATIHEATGYPVAAAFNAGNLDLVAKALRAKFPELALILCADDDAATEGNPGLTKATEAAQAVDGLLAIPDFGTERPTGATDFNDLAALHGLEAVKQAIAGAKAPARETHQPDAANMPGSNSYGQEWPEPRPLPEGLPPVEPFDLSLLPEPLQPWARDICERVQCPPDYVGATIMAALGSVIGRKVGIRPQEKTDWTEFSNQWALIVGRPGVLKSPAMEAALLPLKRLAAQAVEVHGAEMEEYEQAARMAKLRAEAGEKAARAKLAKNPGADVSGDLATDALETPALRRYIVNDTTAAALGELLRQNPNGLLAFRDEMVSLLKSLDREDSADARGFYLTGWNGNSAYTFDRIGRGMNLHIPAVCLSLLGSTQPGRIAEYLRTAVKGGAGDDGLIQRFGLLVWPDIGASWRDVDRWPDTEARREANHVFEMLDRLDPMTVGAKQDTGRDGEPDGMPFLRFDNGGLALFREWRETWEPKLRAGELHPALESHLAKYRKLVPGLALILHLASGKSGPIGGRATLQGLAWAEYLESHARRAYASVTSPEVMAAKAIIGKLRGGELPHIFAARDIYRRGWAHLSDREQVSDALQLLADFEWLAVHVRDTGGRAATLYEANPRGIKA